MHLPIEFCSQPGAEHIACPAEDLTIHPQLGVLFADG